MPLQLDPWLRCIRITSVNKLVVHNVRFKVPIRKSSSKRCLGSTRGAVECSLFNRKSIKLNQTNLRSTRHSYNFKCYSSNAIDCRHLTSKDPAPCEAHPLWLILWPLETDVHSTTPPRTSISKQSPATHHLFVPSCAPILMAASTAYPRYLPNRLSSFGRRPIARRD